MRFERSYGGKAGIWLKTRRNSQNRPLQIRSTPVAPIIQSDTAKSESVDSLWDKNSSSSKLESIGWDDTLCRPIYQGAIDPSTGVDVADVNSNNARPTYQVTNDDENMLDFIGFEERSEVQGKRSRRKYGSQKRPRVDLSGAERSSNIERPASKRQRKISNRDEDAPVLESTQQSRDGTVCPSPAVVRSFALASPAPQASSICLTLNSETKTTIDNNRAPEYKRRSKKTMTDREVQVHVEPAGLEVSKPPRPLPSRIRSKRTTGQFKSTKESDAEFDFEDETVHRQPSSKTSVDAAKAFFERLDSTEKLAIDDSDTPKVPGKRCVRTTRLTNVADPNLRKEYDRYVAASTESGVEPLSIRDYAANRSTYFRSSDMYDGFLDE